MNSPPRPSAQIFTSLTNREFFPRLSFLGVCKLTIESTNIPRTYKMMVAESPTNFQPLNIVDHYYAVVIVLLNLKLGNRERRKVKVKRTMKLNCQIDDLKINSDAFNPHESANKKWLK